LSGAFHDRRLRYAQVDVNPHEGSFMPVHILS
jgi:hypothetical protein